MKYIYHCLSCRYLCSFQNEIDDAAKNGWRMVNFAFTNGTYIAFLEKLADKTDSKDGN